MLNVTIRFLLITLFTLWPVTPARAIDCIVHILDAEYQYKIPSGLLMAIGQVESGLHPWAVNLNGTSHYPKTKEAASKLLIKRKGHTAVGCMQLAVRWHGMHFKNNAAMLDPKDNIDYAARFLVSLYKRTGDWRKAVMGYHGGTAEQNKVYLEKIARQVVIDFD